MQTRWVPLFPNGDESAMMSSDTDPKTWREAMAAEDALEWIEGLEEEMDSLRAHKIFMLIPRHSIPTGRHIIKLDPTAIENTMSMVAWCIRK